MACFGCRSSSRSSINSNGSSVFLCIYARAWAFIRAYARIFARVYACTCLGVRMHSRVYAFIRVCTFVCARVCACLHVARVLVCVCPTGCGGRGGGGKKSFPSSVAGVKHRGRREHEVLLVAARWLFFAVVISRMESVADGVGFAPIRFAVSTIYCCYNCCTTVIECYYDSSVVL